METPPRPNPALNPVIPVTFVPYGWHQWFIDLLVPAC